MFISFDIGKDEKFVEQKIDSFQDFEERKESVCESGFKKNPHMAGTYGTALYFLKEKYKLNKEWDILVNQNQFFREALIQNADKLPNDILDKIALIKKISTFAVLGNESIKRTKHPIFGKMSYEEWDKLQYMHLDHHLRQFGV